MTTRKNHDSTSEIYLTSIKVEQFRMVDYNSREKLETKGRQHRRHPPAIIVFIQIDLKCFRNDKTAWITYCHLRLKKICPFHLFPSSLIPSRMPLSASLVIWATYQIT